jgi:hypothetical protein
VVVRRRGASTLGCLFTLLLIAAFSYFAVNVSRPAYRYWLIRDAMQQEAKFAGMRSDAAIQRRLRQKADSIGLPPEAAANLRVRRIGEMIVIVTEYTEHVEFPGFVKLLTFHPSVQGLF